MTRGSGRDSTVVVAPAKSNSSNPSEATPTGERQFTEQGRERKQQLIDAAMVLFAEGGYAATRISDICERAGVAKGLFYWYFPTKLYLFSELVRSMRQRLRRSQAAAMEADADPIGQQRHALAFWDHVVDGADSIVFRLMFNTLRSAYEPALPALAIMMAAEVGRSEAYRTLARAIGAGDPEAAQAAARQLLEPATQALIAALSAMEEKR